MNLGQIIPFFPSFTYFTREPFWGLVTEIFFQARRPSGHPDKCRSTEGNTKHRLQPVVSSHPFFIHHRTPGGNGVLLRLCRLSNISTITRYHCFECCPDRRLSLRTPQHCRALSTFTGCIQRLSWTGRHGTRDTGTGTLAWGMNSSDSFFTGGS